MDPRQVDLAAKLKSLEKLLGAGADGAKLFEAAEATALALEFRDTDAMIGLEPVSGETLERARALVQKAREQAVSAGVPEACLAAAKSMTTKASSGKRRIAAGAQVSTVISVPKSSCNPCMCRFRSRSPAAYSRISSISSSSMLRCVWKTASTNASATAASAAASTMMNSAKTCPSS